MTNDQIRELWEHLDKRIEARFAYLLREILRIEAGEPRDPTTPPMVDMTLADSFKRSQIPIAFEITEHQHAGPELDRLIVDLVNMGYPIPTYISSALPGELEIGFRGVTVRVLAPVTPRGRSRRRWKLRPSFGPGKYVDTRAQVCEQIKDWALRYWPNRERG